MVGIKMSASLSRRLCRVNENGNVVESLAAVPVRENVRTYPNTEIKAFTYGLLFVSNELYQGKTWGLAQFPSIVWEGLMIQVN